MIADRRPRYAWDRRFAAALLACLLTACGSPEAAIEARPAMWLVADADTRIFLLGTMHALPKGTDWDDGKIAEAIGAADELVMELTPDELAGAGAIFRSLAPRTAPLAMESRLPPRALARYRALEASGSAFEGDALDDWAVMVLMGQRAAQNAALSPADGVETALAQTFKAASKPINGLESARAQLTLFETLAPTAQRALLVRAAEGADDAVKDIERLAAAWSRADVAALEAIINEDIDAVPAARKALLTDRNRAWALWVLRRLDRPGTVLVAVGAGHLVGSDGVPAMIEAEGINVLRVQ